jgi:hypothetical protein
MRFLKMSTFLYTTFLAETNLAVGQLVRVIVNGKEILKLRGITQIPVVFKDV